MVDTGNRWLATRLAAGAGILLGGACAVFGLFAFEKADPLDGFVFLLMGWFVISSSKHEQVAGRAQHVLGDVHVSDVMRPAVIAPGWLTVGAFWNEWVKPYPEAAFVLERWGGGHWSGVVTAQQLAAVPPGMHWSVSAQDVALPLPPPPARRRGPVGAGSARPRHSRASGGGPSRRGPRRHRRGRDGPRHCRHGRPGDAREPPDVGRPAAAASATSGYA